MLRKGLLQKQMTASRFLLPDRYYQMNLPAKKGPHIVSYRWGMAFIYSDFFLLTANQSASASLC